MIRVALPGLVGVALLTSCLSPTQVTVVLSTDVPCSSHPVTTIAIGPPGQAETRTPQTTTTNCTSGGQIGSIVVTPGSDNGATFEIQVVVGVGAGNPPSCTGKDSKCITARREIAFVPHTPLTLPIELDEVCLGFSCPVNETCVEDHGAPTCKSAHTMPGCGAKVTCDTTSSSGSGMGGAGAGGAGMGGMSSSGGAGGGGGKLCAEKSCVGCKTSKCLPVTDDPTVTFQACYTGVPAPPECTGTLAQCCATMACPQTVGQPENNCIENPDCSGPKKFVCKQDQWNASTPCTGTDVPVKKGFLNLGFNACVPNNCGACVGFDNVCIPVLLDCCTIGLPKIEFACVKRDEPCCKTSDCTQQGQQCIHGAGNTGDELQCTACVSPARSSGPGEAM